MKSLWKRILCMAITLCLMLQPVAYVQAENNVSEDQEETTCEIPAYVNPLYADVITEEDLVAKSSKVRTASEIVEISDEEEIVEYIRESMIAREETLTFCYVTEEEYDAAWLETWWNAVFEETDDSHAGDYLESNYAGRTEGNINIASSDDVYYYTYTLPVLYHTTASQEAAFDAELENVLEELGVKDDSLSSYEKMTIIYDYICDYVEYDYDNLEDDTYTLKYTAYAALIDGTSVCQGFAALLYRMLEAVGIDTRMVTGQADNGESTGGHAWNISKVGGKYYYSDATWDEPRRENDMEYEYFLKGSTDFEVDHFPDDDSPVKVEPYAELLSETDYDPDSDATDEETNEDTDEQVQYTGLKVTGIEIISENKDELEEEGEFQVAVTLLNDSAEEIGIDTECLEIVWEDEYNTYSTCFDSGYVTLDADQTVTLQTAYHIEKYAPAGKRVLQSIDYMWGELTYTYDEDMKAMVGVKDYEDEVHSFAYEGEADWNMPVAENADTEVPYIEKLTVEDIVLSEEEKYVKIRMDISDEGAAPVTWINFFLRDTEIEQNYEWCDVELDESKKVEGGYEFSLPLWENAVAGTYKVEFCTIADAAYRERAYELDEDGAMIDDMDGHEMTADDLVIPESEYISTDRDFTAPVFTGITLDSIEIEAGGTISGTLQMEDESGIAEVSMNFYSEELERDVNVEVTDFVIENGVYKFNTKIPAYVLPGEYRFEYLYCADDSVRNNGEGYNAYVETEDEEGEIEGTWLYDITINVVEAEGTVVVEAGEENLASAIANAENGDTFVVLADNHEGVSTLTTSFMQTVKEKEINLILKDGNGELVIDPEDTIASFEEEIQVNLDVYAYIDDPVDCEPMGVDSFLSFIIQMDPDNIPVTVKIDTEFTGFAEDAEYYLFTRDDANGYQKISDLEYKDGGVEIAFSNGINGGSATESEDGELPAYRYYVGFKKVSYCTEHKWNAGRITVAPTCMTEGEIIYKCTVSGCDATKTEAAPIDEDNHKSPATYTFVQLPDCENGGILALYCENGCGHEFEECRIETHPLGHKYKDVLTKATTKADGKIQSKCSVCGDVEKTTTIYKPSSITLSTTTYTYNGSVKTPTVTVKDSEGNKLEKNVDYTVSYASGRKKVGKYTVKITFKGNYSGTVSKTFKIIPKTTKLTSLTKATKAFTAKWSKQSTQVTGYQIQYARNKSFSGASLKTVTSYKTTSLKVTGLKAKTKYYVRVRTYKTVNGVKYYSNWSAYKTVTTK